MFRQKPLPPIDVEPPPLQSPWRRLAAVGSLATALGGFLPWLTYTTLDGERHTLGTLSSITGSIEFVLGLALIGLLAWRTTAYGPERIVRMIPGGLAVVVFAMAVSAGRDVQVRIDAISDLVPGSSQIQPGLVILVAGASVAAFGAFGATRNALSTLAPSLEPPSPSGLDRSFFEAIIAGAVGLIAGIAVGVAGSSAINPSDPAHAAVVVYVSALTSLFGALCASYGWSRLRASVLRRR